MNRDTLDEEKGTLWKWFAAPVWPYVESLIDNLGEFRFLLGSEQSECPLNIDPQTVVPLLGRANAPLMLKGECFFLQLRNTIEICYLIDSTNLRVFDIKFKEEDDGFANFLSCQKDGGPFDVMAVWNPEDIESLFKVTKRILKALRFFNLHEFQKHYGNHVEALAPLIKEMTKLKNDRNVHRLHLRSTRPDQRLVYCGQLGVVERLLSHVGAISDEETNNLILDNYESFKVFFTATTSFRPQKKLAGFQQGKKPTTVKLTFHAGKTVNMFCQSILGDKLLKREEVATSLKTLAQEVTKKVIAQMFRGLPFRRSFVSQLMARFGTNLVYVDHLTYHECRIVLKVGKPVYAAQGNNNAVGDKTGLETTEEESKGLETSEKPAAAALVKEVERYQQVGLAVVTLDLTGLPGKSPDIHLGLKLNKSSGVSRTEVVVRGQPRESTEDHVGSYGFQLSQTTLDEAPQLADVVANSLIPEMFKVAMGRLNANEGKN